MPGISGIHETVLYGDDLAALAAFYRDVLGLRIVREPDELAAAIRLPGDAVLLLFDAEVAGRPGRDIPSHGAKGPGHVAFRVADGALREWGDRLRARGVSIEREVDWDGRGRSLYLRDPAGNSVELVEGDIWPA